MSLFVRGFIWFGLYLLLIALPAAVAVIVHPFDAPRPALVETSDEPSWRSSFISST